MNIFDRRANLTKQINNITDEQTLEMLEATLEYYTHHNSADITDALNAHQRQELISLLQEPGEKDTISEEEFKKTVAKWNTK